MSLTNSQSTTPLRSLSPVKSLKDLSRSVRDLGTLAIRISFPSSPRSGQSRAQSFLLCTPFCIREVRLPVPSVTTSRTFLSEKSALAICFQAWNRNCRGTGHLTSVGSSNFLVKREDIVDKTFYRIQEPSMISFSLHI